MRVRCKFILVLYYIKAVSDVLICGMACVCIPIDQLEDQINILFSKNKVR